MPDIWDLAATTPSATPPPTDIWESAAATAAPQDKHASASDIFSAAATLGKELVLGGLQRSGEQVARGVKELAEPAKAALVDLGRNAVAETGAEPPGASAVTPELARQAAQGAHDVIAGAAPLSIPAMAAGAVAAPVATAVSLGVGVAARATAQAAAKSAGVRPEYINLIGDIAMLGGGLLTAGWTGLFDKIDAHNATAETLVAKEAATGKAAQAAQTILGADKIPVNIGNKAYTVEPAEAAPPSSDLTGTPESLSRPQYKVVDAETGKTVVSGNGKEVGQYLGTNGAKPATEAAPAQTAEQLDKLYSDTVAERAEAQSAADQARNAGKRDIYAEAVAKDADQRLSDIQKQRAQLGAPGTQLPAGQRNPAAPETNATTFETRPITAEDVAPDQIFQDKSGRTAVIKSIGPTGRVTFVSSDGQTRTANSPAQFAGRMAGIAVQTPPQAQPTPETDFTGASFAPEASAAGATPIAQPSTQNATVTAPQAAPAVPLSAGSIPAAPATPQGEGNIEHVQKLEQAAGAVAPAAAPVPSPQISQTGLAEAGGGMAHAITGNMYGMLWDKVQAGDETEGGVPSAVLQAAKQIRSAGGLQTPEQFQEYAKEYAAIEKGAGFQGKMRALVEKYTPETQFAHQQTQAESDLSPEEHRAEVVDAIRRGEDVPPEVLASHPGVVEQAIPSKAITQGGPDIKLNEFAANRGGFASPARLVITSPQKITADQIQNNFFPGHSISVEKVTPSVFTSQGNPDTQMFKVQFHAADGAHISVPSGIEEALGLEPGKNFTDKPVTGIPERPRAIEQPSIPGEKPEVPPASAAEEKPSAVAQPSQEEVVPSTQAVSDPLEIAAMRLMETGISVADLSDGIPDRLLRPDTNLQDVVNSLQDRGLISNANKRKDSPALWKLTKAGKKAFDAYKDSQRAPSAGVPIEDERRPGTKSPTIEGEAENAATAESAEHPGPLEEVPPAHGGGTGAEETAAASVGERGETDSGRVGEGDRGGTGSGSGVGSAEPELGVPSSGERPATPGREPEPTAADYRITDADEIGKGSARQKAVDNVEAIRTLKKIEEENRDATPAEQKTLAKYVGWGGMPQVFVGSSEYSVPREWQGVRADLDSLLTPEEFASARASTPNAHYTSPTVVRGMWEALTRIGIVAPNERASVLEPSMGVGIFFGLQPKPEAEKAQRVGVELDSITGRIAQLLYPRADIHVAGFEAVRLPSNYFDVAIGNVPFGNYGIHDPAFKKTPLVTRSIHDYFFAKALDRIRPGGVIAFVTSSYTMDKKDSSMRKYLADRADLIGAIRLPNTAFKGNAGTEVTTDVIFLKKRAPQTPAQGETWTKLDDYVGRQKRPDGSMGPADMQINEYYVRHPEMMLGQMGLEGSMYTDKSPALTGELTPEKLAEAVARLPQGVAGPLRPEDRPAFDTMASFAEAGDVKEGAYTIKDGLVVVRVGDRLEPAGFNAEQAGRVKAMINLRDAVRKVFSVQLRDGSDAEVKSAQKLLNEFYDEFVKRYGTLHQQKNARLFADDPDAPLLLSLENWDAESKKATKAAIFTERTIDSYRPVTSAATAKDAMSVVLNEKGRLDWTRMQDLTGKTPAELRDELGGLIYNNPSGKQWETADSYLSGNVRQKLAEAETAARSDPQYQRNVEALKAIQPTDLEPHEIDGRLGSAWIPKSDIQRFVSELLGLPEGNIRVGHAEALGSWTVEVTSGRDVVANRKTWGTNRFRGDELIQDALNVKTPTAYDRDSDGKTHVNEKETLAARSVQQQIKEEFAKWLWLDQPRSDRLARSYNDDFNNLRLREYDGSHLTFPGMAAGLTLRKHQKNAVWRMLQSGNTLLAHVVGAGKTLEIISGAMEMRRIGLARKPMAIVPKNRVEGTASDWLAAYPAANILTMSSEDFTAKNRQRMLARIATGNWDGVIVSYESFERLPISDETFNAYLQKQIDQLEDYIRSSKADKSDAKVVKELEKSKKRLEAKLRNRNEGIARDRSVNFEDLGVDALFVDEADNFKNLYFPTKMTRVKGIPNTESKRAFDMYIKTQYVAERNGGQRGVIFATGTPIANTMAEMFTMQRYLQPQWLEEHGLSHFDAWAQTFGEVQPTLETNISATGVQITNRFAAFVNIPELVSGFRMMADVQTADMLKLPVPKLKGGRAKIISAEASPAQKAYLNHLAGRMKAIKDRKVKPDEDNPLKVSTDGRKAALDIRLVMPDAPDNPGSKVNLAANNVARIWKETSGKKSTQLVFLDFSRPTTKGESHFSVSDDLKAKLMAQGIPAKEIAFVPDDDDDKEILFREINDGKVRVLIGSTQKMGVGLNVQKLLVALHHLDAPWRPRDVEQREGRILRQGNTNEEVQIYTYVTEPSFDAKMWDTLKTKATFIAQVMRGDVSVRRAEDISETALNYAEVSAIASGNPAIREKAMVDAEVRKLDAMRSRHDQMQFGLRRDIATLPASIAGDRRILGAIQEDINTVSTHEPAFTIGKNTFSGEGARKKADDALTAIREKHRGDPSLVAMGNDNFAPIVVGSYRGLTLELGIFHSYRPADADGNGYLPGVRLRGRQTYDTENSAASIEATADSRPLTRKRNIEAQIATAEKKLSDSREVVGQKFEQADKLEAALRRQAELDTLLQTKEPDAQASAGEGEDTPEEQAAEFSRAIEQTVDPTSGAIASYKTATKKMKLPAVGGWWQVDAGEGRILSTDGHYVVTAKVEPESTSRSVPVDAVTRFLAKSTEQLPVEPAAWQERKIDREKTETTVIWFSDGTGVNAMYYDDAMRRYPGASFYHEARKGETRRSVQSDVVLVADKTGTPVAAIMPFYGIEPPESVSQHLAKRSPVGDPRAGYIDLSGIAAALDKIFSKKAKDVDYQAFGAEPEEPEEKRYYNYRAALKSSLGTGTNLSQVRMASVPAWKALVKMASADSVTRVTIRRAELAIHQLLENAPVKFPDLIRYYSESRLRGIRDRWYDLAQQAEGLDDEQLEEAYTADFSSLLGALENKRGIPQNVRQTADALAVRQDWSTLRDFVAQAFSDAGGMVSTLMEDEDFDRIRKLVAENDKVSEADRIYGKSIESLMADYHAEHEGVMSTALGPADRYVPLTGVVPENAKGARKGTFMGIRRPFKKPRNERALFATGISPYGYDTTLEALEKGLINAVRSSSKFQAIEAMENAGMLRRYTSKTAPESFRFQGEYYPAERIEISPPRTILIKEGGRTRSIHMPAQMAVTARWIYDEVKPILEADKITENAVQRLMDPANAAAIFGPTLAIIDSHNILSTLTANTPFLGATLAEKGLSAPLLKRFSAAVMLARQIEPLNEEAFDDLIQMAKIGVLPAKYGGKTWSSKVAEMSGAQKSHWWDFTPFLYGPAGVDVRGRLKMYRIAKALNPDVSDEELHDFINQIGTYIPGLQSNLERTLKKIGLSPFFTRGAQMLANGVHSLTGTGPMPKKGLGMRMATLITGGAIALVATWLTVSKMAGWKPVGLLKSEVPIPDDARHSALGKQLGWDKNGTMVVDFTMFNPLVARGSRALGLLAATDTMMEGGNWWQAIEYGTAQSLSTVAQPVLFGPVQRSALVAITGQQPYLTGLRDRHGALSLQTFPAVPPRHAGLLSFGERAAAGLASANAMESQLGQATGFISPLGDPGGRYLGMIADMVLPGVNPKAVNLYSRQQMLYQQRTGTR